MGIHTPQCKAVVHVSLVLESEEITDAITSQSPMSKGQSSLFVLGAYTKVLCEYFWLDATKSRNFCKV